jgi:quinate dehydrogenase (quinone)
MRGFWSVGAAVLAAALACSSAYGQGTPDRDWPFFGNDSGAQRFSPIDEINRDTVKRLKVAWTYNTGDSDGERPQQPSSPARPTNNDAPDTA